VTPARRLAGVRVSPIRVISEGAPPESIPLGLGEPTWDLPEPARRALAATAGPVGYGPNAGLVELRDAVAAFHGVTRDEVVITAGSQGALFSLFHGWVDPGDEVLVPDPGFPAYAALAKLCGGAAIPYPLAPDDGFRLRAAAVIGLLEARPAVRAVVVNHPANPTGAGATAAELGALAAACDARGVLLVSDEVYRDLHFGTRPPSLRDVTRTGAVVSSISKGFGSPGLRVGWMIADRKWLDPARTVHNYAVTSAAIPCQLAALAMLREPDGILAAARDEVARRFAALQAACRTHLGLEIAPPAGAFYAWLRLPPSADLSDPIAFGIRLRDEAGVVIAPGIVFGEGGRAFARVSFAARPDQIAEGIRRLARWWR
jgi:aspartate/methionine/tyrosine aminotransferase